MKSKYFISLGVLIASLILMPVTAIAQSYIEIYPGSKFVCGLQPDGSNLIFVNGGVNDSPVPAKKAISSVKKDIERVKSRIERLNDLKSSLSDGNLSKKELGRLSDLVKDVDPSKGETLPLSKAERKAIINSLIAKLKVEAKNKQNEIKAIRDCDDGKRPEQPADSIETEFLKFYAADGLYIALIMYVPVVLNPEGNPYPQRWYCVQSGLDDKGAPRLFTGNPCYQGVPAFSGNSCTQFNRKGYLAEFFRFRVFKGILPALDDPIVIEAEADFQAQYAGGIAGRPRKSLADDCSFID